MRINSHFSKIRFLPAINPRWKSVPERFEKYHKFKEHLLRKTGFKKLVMEPSDNYRYWTGSSAKKAFEAQQALLEGLQYVSEFVGIGKDYINTICLNQDEPVAKKTLVMAHGYGAALGFFYKNYPDLKELKEYKTYSIDWLGMGVSSRPMFVKHHKAHSDLEVVENAENFFVDSLEEWRIKKNIEKFVLMGHSLGGYLGTAYALKYPERVEKLILVSPVGIPEAPKEDPNSPQSKSYFLRFARFMWGNNITPMSIIRMLGPLGGANLVTRYSSSRFANLEKEQLKRFDEYLYHICAQPGSGEFALSRLLLPGAFARMPLASRLSKLTMPTTFIYGDRDWMDHRHAVKAAPNMKVKAKVAVVGDSGHHLYLDNSQAFNDALIAELKDTDSIHSQVGYAYHYDPKVPISTFSIRSEFSR